MRHWRIWIGITILLVTVAADRIAKIATNDGYRANFGFVRWTMLHNDGAAGGMLAGHTGFLIVVGLVVLGFLLTLPSILQMRTVFFWIGWGLATGGAVGNLWDRIVHGYVIDMFQFPHQHGVFNVSDIGIQFGVVLMLVTWSIAEVHRGWVKRRRAA